MNQRDRTAQVAARTARLKVDLAISAALKKLAAGEDLRSLSEFQHQINTAAIAMWKAIGIARRHATDRVV